MSIRAGELRADQQGLDAAGAEEDERREEVEEADAFVVDGRQPAEQAGTLFPDQLEPFETAARRGRGEDLDGYLSPSR